MSNPECKKILTEENVFSNLRRMQYAVRGPVLDRAIEIQKELREGVEKPFKVVTKVDIGDCQAMGQRPITFLRQVLALTVYPELLDDPRFPEDAKQRAREALGGCLGNSVGSYSEGFGLECIRKRVARYIETRDGIPSDYRNIVLTNGATAGIKCFLHLFAEHLDGKPSGVMIPIPQYPLYSAAIAEFGLARINYYLNEEDDWGLSIGELERAYEEATKTCNPRVLVVINPGNPTGQVLTRRNIEDVVRFAYEKRLFLLADEVYQVNVYTEEKPFHSFKKVMTEMGAPYANMELASFVSLSKGYMGECGLRGGYAEYVNMEPGVMAILDKMTKTMLCPTVLGQVAMSAVVNPPKPGEPSYKLFEKERAEVLHSLAEKSRLTVEILNSVPGIKCNRTMGAMYAFPRFELPAKALKAAKAEGKEPDVFYAFKLLEATGICAIAGSCFGQKPGTYHLRLTILPRNISPVLNSLKQFHEEFLKKYS